jgi:maltooligosyltrehalose trehalohydrolase
MKSCGGHEAVNITSSGTKENKDTNRDLPKSQFGPLVEEGGCVFRLWARPDATIELVLGDGASARCLPMEKNPDGMYEVRVPGVGPGTRYWFKIDGQGPFPDPASRFQPNGVHGPSEVIASADRSEREKSFQPPPLRELIIYELHVGTFTPEGTFLGTIEKLEELRQLGINVIELMPIADFAGDRNWGYDGVSLYAPSHSYGTPGDLRALVQASHRYEIAVCLDVVYNHLGPDGAYQSVFAPQFYSGRHKTPWGDGLNFDGEDREKVRAYFIESALMWIHDYDIDGLRVDATHAIVDDSQPPFLTELTEQVHAAARHLGKDLFIIAEDERNERNLILRPERGGNGFDAVWSDDFHHHLRHRLAGDCDGYYRDFDGTTESIARTIRQGWDFSGQFASHSGHARGTAPDGLSHESHVFCIQNHDQIGNRAFGERLSTQISCPAYYAASALLLLAPEIPLVFMGQEWAAPEPFLYFTNHNPGLGRLVTEGRRKEFEHFSAFTDEKRRERIPDPQAEETFLRSKLDWNRRDTPGSTACLRWYRALLRVRRHLVQNWQFQSSRTLNTDAIELCWTSDNGKFYAVVALGAPAQVQNMEWSKMALLLDSEQRPFEGEPKPIFWQPEAAEISFQRPGAVLLASGDLQRDAFSGAE